MPITMGVTNLEHAKEIAATLHLPDWLIEVLIVEYLPCRRFLEDDTSILFDFGLITIQDVESIPNPYIIISDLSLFHNVTPQVLRTRILGGIAGLPLSTLGEFPYLSIPEGKVSPSCISFTSNPLNMADWKLYLNGYAVVYDKATGEIFQWNLTAQTIDQFNPAQQGYNPD